MNRIYDYHSDWQAATAAKIPIIVFLWRHLSLAVGRRYSGRRGDYFAGSDRKLSPLGQSV